MKKILLNKKFHAFLMLIFLAVSVQYSESESRWRLALRHFNFDYYNIFKPYELAGHAIIVDVDDKSLAHHSLGQWPWPRTKLAALVTALDELGARAIVFDMVFSEVDRTSPQMMLKLLDEDDDSFQSMKSIITNLPDNDQVFADAIKKAGNVVTGFTYNYGESRNPPRLISKITASTIPRGQRVSDFVKEYEALAGNLSVISRHAKGNGCFFSSVDPDGIVRRVPHFATYSRHEGEISIVYPSLSLEAFRVAHKWSGYDLLLEDSYFQKGLVKPSIETSGGEGVTLVNKAVPFKMLRDTTIPKPDKYIPLTDEANFLVYFADINQANMDQWYISALDVFRGNVDPSRIKGKVVFIGTSAAGLKDLRNTPLAWC
jgi:adenylate cyclase